MILGRPTALQIRQLSRSDEPGLTKWASPNTTVETVLEDVREKVLEDVRPSNARNTCHHHRPLSKPLHASGEGTRSVQFSIQSNYFTEMCSGSEAGSYLRLIDFVYHSTLGLRVRKKKKKVSTPLNQREIGGR